MRTAPVSVFVIPTRKRPHLPETIRTGTIAASSRCKADTLQSSQSNCPNEPTIGGFILSRRISDCFRTQASYACRHGLPRLKSKFKPFRLS